MERIKLARIELQKAELEFQSYQYRKRPINQAEATVFEIKREKAFMRRQQARERLNEIAYKIAEEAYL